MALKNFLLLLMGLPLVATPITFSSGFAVEGAASQFSGTNVHTETQMNLFGNNGQHTFSVGLTARGSDLIGFSNYGWYVFWLDGQSYSDASSDLFFSLSNGWLRLVVGGETYAELQLLPVYKQLTSRTITTAFDTAPLLIREQYVLETYQISSLPIAPEPSAWLLLVSGLGAVGLAKRKAA
jgi:hypothetical protein